MSQLKKSERAPLRCLDGSECKNDRNVAGPGLEKGEDRILDIYQKVTGWLKQRNIHQTEPEIVY